MKAARVLVFGATGFVGRHVSAAFSAAGHPVVHVARRVPADAVGLWAPLDLAEAGRQQLTGFLRTHRPQVVVNAAGVVWQADERRMQDINLAFVRRLVDVLPLLAGPPRLIQVGSVHEYGPVPTGVDIVEDLVPRPVSAYGRTKLAGARCVLEAATGDLQAVVLRVANACGPGTPPESLLGVVAAHLRRQAGSARAPEPLRVAPLRAYRDFVDVRDVADAVVQAAVSRTDLSGRVFNVARGTAVGVRDLVERMISLSGLPVAIVEESGPAAVRSDAEWQRVDIGSARTVLGWKPERDLDESLRDVLVAAGVQPQEGEERR